MNSTDPNPPPSKTRLGDGPLISPALCASIGTNINGPSVLRVPDDLPGRLGRYHMYFAHHMGRHIRMAYADALTGPWTVHSPGVLDVTQSLFVPKDLDHPPRAQWPDWVPKTATRYLYAHVASPDVHFDPDTGRIWMYYHGLLPNHDQMTRVAWSTDGLSFTPLPDILGPPYFRVFRHGGWLYALSWGGGLHRARRWSGPFEPGPPLFSGPPLVPNGQTFRHCAVLCRGDRLDLFYTCIGDRPERILHARIALSGDWHSWRLHPPSELLRPQTDWEGVALPMRCTQAGAAEGPEHALRDPCILAEGQDIHMFYCGSGEANISVARLNGL